MLLLTTLTASAQMDRWCLQDGETELVSCFYGEQLKYRYLYLKKTFCGTWSQVQGPAKVDGTREDFDAYRI